MIAENRYFFRSHTRFLIAALFVASTLLVMVAPLAAQDEQPDNQPFYDVIWWNQPKKVEALGLSDELRAQMNTKLDAYLVVRRQHQQGKSFEEFSAAAERGDWDAAAEAADAVALAYSEPMRAQMQLIIDVTGLMSAEQRRQMVEKFPRILKRPWVRTMRAPSGGDDRSRGNRAGKRGNG